MTRAGRCFDPSAPGRRNGVTLGGMHDVVVGADGIRGGWVWVAVSSLGLACGVDSTARDLHDRFSHVQWLSIDVPIGLPERGPRRCDREARALLGAPRSSSVFSAPVRAVLAASQYDEASELHRRADGRSMSVQAFHLLPKIREVDVLVREGDRGARHRWREVHPEVSFALWNGGRAMAHAKRTPSGREERLALVEARWPGAYRSCRTDLRGCGVAADDLLDAFAAAWSAERRRDGCAIVLPGDPEVDAYGVRMEIVA